MDRNDNCKVLCFYLPQFHETPDNNKWWGEGYTEWTAVKNAKPYFKGHRQPREPENDNYYDLSDATAATWKWQSELAGKYGVYGFVIYHYWFGGKKELYRPAEILRDHPEIGIRYSLCWDNNEWRRTWYGTRSELLIAQDYGDESMWKRHFDDLLPFFQDPRYIKIDNKPVFHIFACHKIPCYVQMAAYWNCLAKEQGFDGIYLISGDYFERDKVEGIDAYYNFEPNRIQVASKYARFLKISIDVKNGLRLRVNKFFHRKRIDTRNAALLYRLLCRERQTDWKKKTYRGIWVRYDDTPRRQEKGIYYKKATLERFSETLCKLLRLSQEEGLEFVYINAWNEWGEGAYLEPDKEYGCRYLQAIRDAVERTDRK